MAVRKLRKKMKPVIWVITVAFFLSMVLVGVSSMKNTMSREALAFKINGEKVTTIKADVAIDSAMRGYAQYLKGDVDQDLVSTIAISNLIEKELTLNIAKKLKVKVAKSDVNAEYKKIEESVGDKQQFSRMLQAQGYNITTFKKEITDSMTSEKTIEKIKEGTTLTEEEVVAKYEDGKYGAYLGKSLDEVREQIETQGIEEKSNIEYSKLLKAEKKTMELELKDTKYEKYMEKSDVELDGFVFTNHDVAKRTLRNLFASQGDLEAAKTMTTNNIERDVKIAKEAILKGIKVDEALPVEVKMYKLREGLTEDIKANYVIDEEELNTFFETRRTVYDVAPSISANIAVFDMAATDADKAVAKAKAETILAEVTPENFADMAKEKSEGPSGPNGGALGTFGKGQMVAPFEEAVFKGEVGVVYPEIVETQFGYHIIYVEDKQEEKVTASHILIKVEATELTKLEIKNAADAAASKVTSGELKFEDLANGEKVTSSKLYEEIRNGGYINDLGYKVELTKSLFDAPINEVAVVEADGGIYITEKTKQVEFKAAVLSEMRDRVEDDFLNEKSQEELIKIVE